MGANMWMSKRTKSRPSQSHWLAEALEGRMLLSGATMVKDINVLTDWSNPSQFTVAGNTMYFTATQATTGTELWKTDGTAAGTVLVDDIVPGSGSSNPKELTAAGSGVFFTTAAGGLWYSDGTPAGTRQLTTVTVANNGWYALGSHLYFSANDGVTGYEPWASDGTAAGTHLIKDINPGSAPSTPAGFVQLGGNIYFAAADSTHGEELWKTDGTAPGTSILADIYPGSGSSNPNGLTVFNNRIYFAADDALHGVELWSTDGTAAGTALVKDIVTGTSSSTPQSFVQVGNTLLFQATDAAHGTELWGTTGTASGTTLIQDMVPGTASPTFYSPIFNLNGAGYFWATGGLWRTDGTSAGTYISSSSIQSFGGWGASTGTSLFFVGPGPNYEVALYVTDGTTSSQVTTNLAPFGGNVAHPLAAMNGAVFFDGYPGPGPDSELMEIPAGSTQPFLIKDINTSQPFGSNPQCFQADGNKVFFLAWDGIAQDYGVWASDGSAGGTQFLTDSGIVANIYQIVPQLHGTTLPDGTFLFGANRELFASDGTAAGTRVVHNYAVPNVAVQLYDFYPIGNKTLFAVSGSASDSGWWITDGTPAGTQLVSNTLILGGTPLDVNGTIYYEGNDASHGYELWKTDGTVAGCTMVADINPGTASSYPDNFTNVNGTLYFTATDASGHTELWKSDGSTAGTVKVTNFGLGPNWISNLAAVGNLLYFCVYTSVSTYQLWKTDGTSAGTQLVYAFGTGVTEPQHMTALGNSLFFVASDPNYKPLSGDELYVTDGTPGGTLRLSDALAFATDTAGTYAYDYSGVKQLVAAGGTLFFVASDGVRGVSLWRSDGTVAGTAIVDDRLRMGSITVSDPYKLIAAGNSVFFAATDQVHGIELWRADAGPALTADAGRPLKIPTGTTVTLSAATSRPNGFPIVSYEWDFNYNGVFHADATGETTTFTGQTNGTYVRWIAVRVTDSAGYTSVDTTPVTFSNPLPQPVFSGPQVVPPTNPTYTLSLSSGGLDPVSGWSINWGDGTTSTASGSSASLAHTYPSTQATYPIIPTVTASAGGSYTGGGIPVAAADPTFGDAGTFVDPGFTAAGNLSLQADGKIVTVGGTTTFQIARYLASGLPDPTFGSGGHVTTQFAAGQAQAQAVAIQPDGGIVVAGTVVTSGQTKWLIARYLPDGELDPAFGQSGQMVVSIGGGPTTAVVGVAIRSDGKIIVGGTSDSTGGGVQFAVVRLNPNGSIDPQFGSNATQVLGFGGRDVARAMAIQPDGKIALAGVALQGAGTSQFGLVRLTPDGQPDLTFGASGRVDVHLNNWYSQEADSLAIQPDGKLVVGGWEMPVAGAAPVGVIARYNSDGSLDTTFGNNAGSWTPAAGTVSQIKGLAVAADGNIDWLAPSGGRNVLLGRLTPAGTPDTNFIAGTGMMTVDLGDAGAAPGRIALQPDGNILLLGSTVLGTVLTRIGQEGPALTATIAPLSTISGTVFLDANVNGLLDAGETGLPGTVVYVDTNNNGQLDTGEPSTTTDASGAYTLGGLQPGTYVVREVTPAGDGQTSPTGYSAAVKLGIAQNGVGPAFGNVSLMNVMLNLKYLLTLTRNFGKPGTVVTGDLNGDGTVNLADFLLLSNHFGKTLAPNPLVVTSTADDGSLGTLRYAITHSNAGDTITFDPTVFAPGSSHTLTLNGSQLELTHNLTIQGPGLANLSISGNNASRIFQIDPSITATISGLTLTAANAGTAYGGAINNSGTLNLTNCPITSSTAKDGGGLYSISGAATVTNCTFSNDTASAYGGALFNDAGATSNVTGCTFLSNSAGHGGALLDYGTALILINDTITQNSSTGSGGGINNVAGNLIVTNCTIVNNTTGSAGGGIFNGQTATINNSIVAQNSTTSAAPSDLAGNSFAGSNNLIGDGSGGLSASNHNLLGSTSSLLNPKLGSLSSNGGPTQTMMPLSGSPVIDAGSNALIPTGISTDQRGYGRIFNGTVDIGAVEFGSSLAPMISSGSQQRAVTTARRRV